MKTIIIIVNIFLLTSCAYISYSNKTIENYKKELKLPLILDTLFISNEHTYFLGNHISPTISENKVFILELFSKQRELKILDNILNRKISRKKKNQNKIQNEISNMIDIKILQLENKNLPDRSNEVQIFFGFYASKTMINNENTPYIHKSFLWGLYKWDDYE